MLGSTIAPALFVVGLMYLVVIKLIPWRRLSYAISIGLGVALISVGKAQLDSAGFQVAALGCLITWLDPVGYWRAKP
jgi:hypothetical protein